ncbi:hypothetical protein HAX54_031028 [Datura stramonium]|uniref:Uncharacterized protein n=1 Tax=Datura stramonium TaxID=4076 RepID=A0ABS8SBM2_DATST|nr:hypothetical protein [Datura stramonium]
MKKEKGEETLSKPSADKVLLGMYFFDDDFKILTQGSARTKKRFVTKLGFLVKERDLPLVQKNSGWSRNRYRIEASGAFESIITSGPGYSFIYIYPFNIGNRLHFLAEAVATSILKANSLSPGEGKRIRKSKNLIMKEIGEPAPTIIISDENYEKYRAFTALGKSSPHNAGEARRPILSSPLPRDPGSQMRANPRKLLCSPMGIRALVARCFLGQGLLWPKLNAVLDSDLRRMDNVSIECLLNNYAHVPAKVVNLHSELFLPRCSCFSVFDIFFFNSGQCIGRKGPSMTAERERKPSTKLWQT